MLVLLVDEAGMVERRDWGRAGAGVRVDIVAEMEYRLQLKGAIAIVIDC